MPRVVFTDRAALLHPFGIGKSICFSQSSTFSADVAVTSANNVRVAWPNLRVNWTRINDGASARRPLNQHAAANKKSMDNQHRTAQISALPSTLQRNIP